MDALGPQRIQHCVSFSLNEAKIIPNQITEGDSDKEVRDDGHVEETFMAEEDSGSPEEAP